MQFAKSLILCCTVILLVSAAMNALQAANSPTTTVVPRLVSFSGKAINDQGKTVVGIAGITCSIYKDQYEGAPLWMETQNVNADAKGNFTVQLGATSAEGLPLDLFTSGEARWLGVRVNGGEEQPRVLLLSVPYALKAADAQTLGGLPASAFLLAGAANAAAAQVNVAASAPSSASTATTSDVTTSGGTVNTLPLFTTATKIESSILTQTGSGTTAKIGINTTSPATTLDVNGAGTIRGTLGLAARGAATATAGKTSQPLSFTASSYNSGTGSAVNQNFRWQAEPAGNNTANPSGTLNLLYGAGSSTPAETGLKIANNGQITFAPAQSFAGLSGVVSSVGLSAPSSDFIVSGSPVKGSGTLSLNWTIAPTSGDVPNSIVKRDANGTINVASLGATLINAAYISAVGVGGFAISGKDISSGNGSAGVVGASDNGIGVAGSGPTGVAGGSSNGGSGVSGSSIGGPGVYATASQTSSGGWAVDAVGTNGATGILAGSDTGYAGFFLGDVDVDGNLSKAGGSFKIDHPLDPANKYLYHSFVESPDMMNIYNGNVTTNAAGEAIVTLPDWFETLNRDFRYQLTVIGTFAQAIVESEVANHQFTIKTDKPTVKVSWQVTGIRQDVWANAHRIPVEQGKPERERGFYLHPELYGAPQEKGMLWATAPRAMKQWQEARAKATSAQKDTTHQ